MKNFKKYLVVLVVITMMITTLVPALAEPTASFQSEAKKLYNLGLYNGVVASTFNPGLNLIVDRETGVDLILRLLCLEEAAVSTYTDSSGNTKTTELNNDLANYVDADFIDLQKQKQVAYAIKMGMIKGYDTGNGQFEFRPTEPLTGNAFATMVLENLGYDGQFTYDEALTFLVKISSSSDKIQNVSDWANTSLTRDQLVGLSYYIILAAKFANSSETTFIQNLLDKNKLTWQQIQNIGLTTDLADSVTEPIGIKSVIAENGKLTVVFNDKLTSDPVSDNFIITRSVEGLASLIRAIPTVESYNPETNTVVLNVPAIIPGNQDHTVLYSVMYKGGTVVTAKVVVAAINVSEDDSSI